METTTQTTTQTTINNSSTEGADADPRPALLAAMDLVAPVIAAAAKSDPTLATPCEDLPVGAMLAHLNSVGQRIVAIGSGKPGGDVPDSSTPPDGDWSAAWASSSAQAREIWAQRDLDAEAIAPWRTMTVAEAAAIYCSEVTVHGWDLAVATGTAISVPDQVAEVAAHALATQLPPTNRHAFFNQVRSGLPEVAQFHDPYLEAKAIDDSASPLDVLVARSGREPGWSPSA